MCASWQSVSSAVVLLAAFWLLVGPPARALPARMIPDGSPAPCAPSSRTIWPISASGCRVARLPPS